MKLHNFLGGDKDGLYLEEMDIRFLVHKSLINESTNDMIKRYMASLRAPKDISVSISGDVYRFEPISCKDNPFVEGSKDYLWFAL